MKKLAYLLLLPMMSLCFIFGGCGGGKSVEQVISFYNEIKTELGSDYFVNDSVIINYNVSINSENLTNYVNSVGTTDLLLRYRALDEIQTVILNKIFNYYENWSDDFYNKITTSNIDSSNDLQIIYDKMNNLRASLRRLKTTRDAFIDELKVSGSCQNIIISSLTEYTHRVNGVIESSIDLVEIFEELHEKYFYNDLSIISNTTVNRMIDEYYFKLAKLFYYEDVLPFTTQYSDSGLCDLLVPMNNIILGSDQKSIYTKLINADNIATDITELKVKLFIQTKKVFDQDSITYYHIYNILDMQKYNDYYYGKISGGIETYYNTLTQTKKNDYLFIDSFKNVTLSNYSTAKSDID